MSILSCLDACRMFFRIHRVLDKTLWKMYLWTSSAYPSENFMNFSWIVHELFMNYSWKVHEIITGVLAWNVSQADQISVQWQYNFYHPMLKFWIWANSADLQELSDLELHWLHDGSVLDLPSGNGNEYNLNPLLHRHHVWCLFFKGQLKTLCEMEHLLMMLTIVVICLVISLFIMYFHSEWEWK